MIFHCFPILDTKFYPSITHINISLKLKVAASLHSLNSGFADICFLSFIPLMDYETVKLHLLIGGRYRQSQVLLHAGIASPLMPLSFLMEQQKKLLEFNFHYFKIFFSSILVQEIFIDHRNLKTCVI